jgi:hypothetical protein
MRNEIRRLACPFLSAAGLRLRSLVTTEVISTYRSGSNSMDRSPSRIVLCVVAVALCLGTATVAGAESVVKAPRPRDRQAVRPATHGQVMIKILSETTETKDFNAPNMTFREFLGLFDEIMSNKSMDLPIGVDFRAFKEAIPKAYPDESHLYDINVKIPSMPNRLPVQAILRIAFSQIPNNDATFLVRHAVIEVLHRAHATPDALARRKVIALFQQRPLAEAVQELADATGASINIDQRVGDRAETLVTATFANDVSLETALRQLATMADLTLVRLGGAFFVTSPANAEAILMEQKAVRRQARKKAS